jgi:hypothetical protein
MGVILVGRRQMGWKNGGGWHESMNLVDMEVANCMRRCPNGTVTRDGVKRHSRY